MVKYGYDGNPLKNSRLNGVIALAKRGRETIRSGFGDGWYDFHLRKLGKNLIHRSMQLSGKIYPSDLGLSLNETEEKYRVFWREGISCDIRLHNFCSAKNTFIPYFLHRPSIGILARYSVFPVATFDIEHESGFYGDIMLPDLEYDLLLRHTEMKWNKNEQGEIEAHGLIDHLTFNYEGYAGYGVKNFAVPNESFRVKGIVIRSIKRQL